MKSDAIAFGIAGVFFGLIAGWIIGAQQAASRPAAAPAVQQGAAGGSAPAQTTRAAVLDEAQVTALRSVALPTTAPPRRRARFPNWVVQ